MPPRWSISSPTRGPASPSPCGTPRMRSSPRGGARRCCRRCWSPTTRRPPPAWGACRMRWKRSRVTGTTRPSGSSPAARRGGPRRSSRRIGRMPTPPSATPRRRSGTARATSRSRCPSCSSATPWGRTCSFRSRSAPRPCSSRSARHRPTILVNVPTMVNRMVSHPDAARQDLSSLRFATSAGEALPVEPYERWTGAFGVELLDGLGTAEMWHIFITNRPGAVRPGTLGQVVPGFEVRVCDESGRELGAGEVGMLWVRGQSRAVAYWQEMEKTQAAFRGEWYVSGDLISRDADGYVTYHGRADEMLKVSGKWLAPQEVESCLLQHPAVREAAVVGVVGAGGLVKPHAFVVAGERRSDLAEELQAFAAERLEGYKVPREVVFMDVLPRTHLGKVDRGKLRAGRVHAQEDS